MKEFNDFWEEEYLGDSEVWTISIYPRKGGCETVGITPSFKEALDAVITLVTDKIADGWGDGAIAISKWKWNNGEYEFDDEYEIFDPSTSRVDRLASLKRYKSRVDDAYVMDDIQSLNYEYSVKMGLGSDMAKWLPEEQESYQKDYDYIKGQARNLRQIVAYVFNEEV